MHSVTQHSLFTLELLRMFSLSSVFKLCFFYIVLYYHLVLISTKFFKNSDLLFKDKQDLQNMASSSNEQQFYDHLNARHYDEPGYVEGNLGVHLMHTVYMCNLCETAAHVDCVHKVHS